MIHATEVRAALGAFDAARDEFQTAVRQVPDAAIPYRKDGDDYSLGGLVVHVAFVLEHYSNVLQSIRSAEFAESRPKDPPGLQERAVERARSSLHPTEVNVELANLDRLHDGISRKIIGFGGDWSRKAPVFFGESAEALPTSAADVLGWLTDHYREHVPHLAALQADWETQSGGRNDPITVVAAFNDAFARGDVDAVMAAMTPDCIFENTFPAPDGERHQGAEAVRLFWTRFFADTEVPKFETEEIVAMGDRVVARWRFSWGTAANGGHVRGIDLFRVRDGKVAEKFSYVKG